MNFLHEFVIFLAENLVLVSELAYLVNEKCCFFKVFTFLFIVQLFSYAFLDFVVSECSYFFF